VPKCGASLVILSQMEVNVVLKGRLVYLREYRKSDIALAHKYINDYEVRRMLVPGIPFPLRLEEEEKWYDSQSAFKDTYNFAISKIEDDEYIGGCGINEVDWKNRVATVGIFLGRQFWNEGFGTDAMKTLLKFIFDQMNMNKAKLNVYSFNKRAIKSYSKCGFQIEGTLRQEIFRDGAFHEEIIMGILKTELQRDD
jgi:RimJ/RimL family protein N-acetyltransferase